MIRTPSDFVVWASTTRGRVIYQIASDSDSDSHVPPLPSAYDREVIYPFPETEGLLSVHATFASEWPVEDRGTVEIEIANGEFHRIRF